ncbi:MAG: glycoside hydrolase [Ignavibacteriae bacterium]|nr:glycoside hydrolase [Ignavibacteria bacterium]MBI3364966.1 glycoside hydrolase [Ignavibacteriota bacterium]
MLVALILACGVPSLLPAQVSDTTLFRHLRWRMIGPHRGGRTVGVAGIPDQPNVFYIGVNNGGVWRTNDYGRTWKPIFDDQSTGSIGALAVAPSNPDILYVGSGEGLQRPDLSVGDGMFKSTDGGNTWHHVGLSDAQQIGAVIVDPRDPNRVFVAVLGHPYGANEERGVFRSTDGSGSWQKVLYKDENTGAIALAFDPTNPDILFADLWSARQAPWENGSWQGKTSGLYKSTDGGTTWRQLTNGLPTGEQGLGRIGFAIAPSDPSRMFAMVDAPDLGGMYRSDDAGEHWARVNAEGRVWGRGSDFAEVKVDPKNTDVIYVANTQTYRSTDGGKTFTGFKGAPGGDDYHTIWINPIHPEIMLFASDQGAVVTVNGGETWGSWYNQPTAQFYHVITDNEFPYNVYGGQQESGSVGIASRGNDGQITFREWHPVGTDEYGYIAPDPLHPNIIYGGRVTRYNRTTSEVQNIAPEAVRSGKYRNLRTAPLLFSPVDQHALYYATNVLFRTTNGGHSWDVVSPDLSRETPDVPASIGMFRTPELAKQARRGVVYAVSLSPRDAKLIWAGTDDGFIHVTHDGGEQWKNVTPPPLTAWSKVAGIEASHFDTKTAYAAVNRIKLDDMHPYIYRTHDDGTTWQEVVTGLPENGPVNVIREDPVRKGLLFAGTERAVYVSFDDGDHWLSLRNNMPATSIRDLVIHNADIVVGTHGRSFWILDDITSLRQMNEEVLRSDAHLFAPDTAYRVRWNLNTDTPIPPDEPAGENPPDGAIIDYYLPREAKGVTLEISDGSHNVVRKYSSIDVPESVDERELTFPTYWLRPKISLSTMEGMHRFVWNLHYAPPKSLPRSFPIAAVVRNTASQPHGPFVLPGEYTVTLSVDGQSFRHPLTITMDPRIPASQAILKEQFDLSMMCYRGLDQVQHLIHEIHALRAQIRMLVPAVKDTVLADSLSSLDTKISAFEGNGPPKDVDIIYFTVQDGNTVKETLNGLQTKLLYVMMLLQGADAQPTEAQTTAARNEEQMLRAMLNRWETYRGTALREVNRILKEHHLEILNVEGGG